MSTRSEAEELLGRLTAGASRDFRPDQWEAIEALVDGRRRVLVVQRTGWGKSAVYFIATRPLRDRGAGPTLLVSPLLALMRNQIEMAERAGVHAASINSANLDDWPNIEARVRRGDVDLLLISPERLNNIRFRRDLLPELVGTVGLLVVDEAHCISDWGHDFRPDYRRISRVLQRLPKGVPVLCTTATANDRVVHDIVDQLGDDLQVIRGPLDRQSLALEVVYLPRAAARLAWLAQVIPELDGSGIVYCLTVGDVERVAAWLREQGIDARAYSGQSDDDDRLVFEQALLRNEVKVVVATSALGMGFDKPDLGFVIHYQSPGSPIAYYQQVGRAGRALDRAPGVLLCGREDTEIQDYFIRTAFPPKEQAEHVVHLLQERAEPVKISEIEGEVNARRTRIEAMLKVLEVEGAVERTADGWRRTLQPWTYDDERVRRVTEARRAEQAAMADYAGTASCRMAFLREQLDDRPAQPCGRCDNCTGSPIGGEPKPELISQALAFLRASPLEIEPRHQWPPGLDEPRGRIPVERQLQPGRTLGVHGDGGWGSVVKHAKHRDHEYPDELVDAAVRVYRQWAPSPAPTWVTCVPSVASPEPVPSFARRQAAALGLAFRPVIERVRDGRPQKEMENSAQQLRNVYGAFAVTDRVPDGPVLLVDDTYDSRWTLTVVGAALREAGSGEVFPFTLARAVSD
jgi:ATP-dependent DNA helicase RecQ